MKGPHHPNKHNNDGNKLPKDTKQSTQGSEMTHETAKTLQTPKLSTELALNNGILGKIVSVDATGVTYTTKRGETHTVSIADFPAPMQEKLKVGAFLPFQKDGGINEIWQAILELYDHGIPPYATCHDGEKEINVYEGFISHYNEKGFPIMFCNHRFNTISQGYFVEGKVPDIGDMLYFSFTPGKHVPEYTVFKKGAMITKLGHPLVIKAVQKEIEQSRKKIMAEKNAAERAIAQKKEQENSLDLNALGTLTSAEIKEKSRTIAHILGLQAWEKNAEIDTVTYRHLSPLSREHCVVGQKVFTKEGRPAIIKAIPTPSNALQSEDIAIAFLFTDKHGHKQHTKPVTLSRQDLRYFKQEQPKKDSYMTGKKTHASNPRSHPKTDVVKDVTNEVNKRRPNNDKKHVGNTHTTRTKGKK